MELFDKTRKSRLSESAFSQSDDGLRIDRLPGTAGRQLSELAAKSCKLQRIGEEEVVKMTKGALKQRFVPIAENWQDSDLFYSLGHEFGCAGIVVWLVLNLEWREPGAEVIERNGTRGLYRRCRFSHIWRKLPKHVGNKKLAQVMLWLHDRQHWILDAETLQDLNRIHAEATQNLHRTDTQSQHSVGAYWPKLLAFREAVLTKGKESKGNGKGDSPPNQKEESPFVHVKVKGKDEYVRMLRTEAEFREKLNNGT